jgi:serine/threonine protein kinase
MRLKIPQIIGQYKVIREVAQGNMGVVYLGYDPTLERPVALKVAHPESLKGEGAERFRKMFFNEAAAGQLDHPHILKIFDAGMDGDICYIVMEFIYEGENLKPHCRPDNLLPVRQVAKIIFDCAEALDYAHRQGVIHRDIKPSNLLLTEEMEVKVADFSIARIIHSEGVDTLPLGFVGSPRYMSPEQIQEDHVGHQTDLFSLGVVMYEMLTGRHPFGGDNFSRLIYKVLNEDPPPMDLYRNELSSGLEAIVGRALEKDPERRFQTGRDFATALAGLYNTLKLSPGDPITRERFLRLKRLDFFLGFPDSEIWEILRAATWHEYAPGDRIVSEGEIDDSVYILTSGQVIIRKNGAAVGILEQGDCFGEMGYVTKFKRVASIVATAPVSLLKISSALIGRVSTDCQLRLCKVFLRTLVRRLSLPVEKAVVGY